MPHKLLKVLHELGRVLFHLHLLRKLARHIILGNKLVIGLKKAANIFLISGSRMVIIFSERARNMLFHPLIREHRIILVVGLRVRCVLRRGFTFSALNPADDLFLYVIVRYCRNINLKRIQIRVIKEVIHCGTAFNLTVLRQILAVIQFLNLFDNQYGCHDNQHKHGNKKDSCRLLRRCSSSCFSGTLFRGKSSFDTHCNLLLRRNTKSGYSPVCAGVLVF